MSKKEKTIKRPYKNLYYTDLHAIEYAYVSQGNCATEDNAKRAAIIQVYMRNFVRASIIDRYTGVVILTLVRTNNGIVEYYGSSFSSNKINTPKKKQLLPMGLPDDLFIQ